MKGKDAPLLQKTGVFYRDAVDPDVWVNSVYSKILADRPRLALISDVRFPNEMAFVKALGGTTVKVSRRDADGNQFVDPSRPADHPSETALDDAAWDITIRNDNGVSDLRVLAVAAANWVLAR